MIKFTSEKIAKIVVPVLMGISLVWSLYMLLKLVYKKLYLSFVLGQYDLPFGTELNNYVGGEIRFLVLLGIVFLLSLNAEFKFLEKIKLKIATAWLCLIIILTNLLSFLGIGEYYGLAEGTGIGALFYIFSFVFIMLSLFYENWLYPALISTGIPLLLFGGILTIILSGDSQILDAGYFFILVLLGLAGIYTGYSKWRVQSSPSEILKAVITRISISVVVPALFLGGVVLIGGFLT